MINRVAHTIPPTDTTQQRNRTQPLVLAVKN